MGFYLAQYTDGRGASFDAGLAKLLGTLGPSAAVPAQSAPPYQPASAPDVPVSLASLGFRGVNVNGTPAIVPPMITIPAGPFLMGSDRAKDSQAQHRETPQHPVEVGAFQIAKYTVTVAEYAFAVRAGKVPEPKGQYNQLTWAQQQQHPDHPIVNVCWQDVMAYIAWLAGITGQHGWRLPSEAEWEKAARWDARRGVSRSYPWGGGFDKARCNTSESGIKTTCPVGSYPASDTRRSGASPYGAEEMAGNVWEWTSSVFKPYPYKQDDGREDLDSVEHRTLRGGSWHNDASVARAAYRVVNRPVDGPVDRYLNHYGFRLALSLAGS
jgi:formylglycine-generating enzyme required for sulfatase activity